MRIQDNYTAMFQALVSRWQVTPDQAWADFISMMGYREAPKSHGFQMAKRIDDDGASAQPPRLGLKGSDVYADEDFC